MAYTDVAGVVDALGGKREWRTEAPMTFWSQVWNRFGVLVSREGKAQMMTIRTSEHCVHNDVSRSEQLRSRLLVSDCLWQLSMQRETQCARPESASGGVEL